ncbi:hypothetical protein [Bacillus sp. P14.5]|uniref:hypothetical protein n=1 Tax=Bacillus sp. P14.5 TaxID=1983400 RepID=UPI000DE857E4|nr:hypothetical protein [Bacillus sp. P14.5]
MRQFLNEMLAGEYQYFLKRRTTFGPADIQNFVPMLVKAQKNNIHSPFISELGIGSMDNHPGYTLRVDTLGKFRIHLGSRIIGESDWQRGKAKELFEFYNK